MADTTFVSKQTTITADWLNAINDFFYTLFNGATTATDARTAIGLGTMATQNSNAVTITGGSVSGLSSPLAVSDGGTGATTFVANDVLLGNGTSSFQQIAPGTSGNVLTSDGTTWASATPVVSGVARVMGCKSKYASTTTWTLSASSLVLRDSSGNVKFFTSPADKTVDNTVSGNLGVDTGSVATSTFYNFYWIAKSDGTLSAVMSTAAPNVGPTLPTGYTYWAYDSTGLTDGASHFLQMQYSNSWGYYAALQNVLANGVQVAETAITITSQVPSIALAFKATAWIHGVTSGGGSAVGTASLRYVTGVNYWTGDIAIAGVTGTASYNTGSCVSLDLPNVSRTLYYITVQTTGTIRFDVNILAFQVPNGS